MVQFRKIWRMRILGDWLKSYVQYNLVSEAPDTMHFWTGVSCIAAVLKQKVYIDQVRFRWIPNFYIVFVAPPWIATKSTTIRVGEELVSKLGTIKIGPDSLTWQALPKLLEEAKEQHTMPDGTIETLSPITFFSSELESLLHFDDHEMIILLTDLWDGKLKPWARVTKTSGSSTISSPYINIIACTTPAGISGLPKRSLRSGFASRMIFVKADRKKQLIPYPSKIIASLPHAQLKADLLHDLEAIACLKGQMQLTPGAIAFGEQWYEKMYRDYMACETEEEQSMMGRKQTQLHKLAMVISVAHSESMIITEADLRAADLLLAEVTQDSTKTVTAVATAAAMNVTIEIGEVITRFGRIGKSDLYRKFVHKLSSKEFKEAIQSLIEAGLINEVSSFGPRVYLEATGYPYTTQTQAAP